MKRFLSLVTCLAILFTVFSGCGNGNENAGSNTSAASSTEGTSTSGKATDLTYWTYQDLHIQFMKDAAQRWNTAHPNEQINLKTESYPVDDMHS